MDSDPCAVRKISKKRIFGNGEKTQFIRKDWTKKQKYGKWEITVRKKPAGKFLPGPSGFNQYSFYGGCPVA